MNGLSRVFRALIRRPGYTALTFVLIATATTATSATLAVVRATLWRDLPYREPAALANITTYEPVNRDSSQQMASSAMMLARWRSDASAWQAIEGYSPITISVAGDGNAEGLSGAAVSAGLFELLGDRLSAGRMFRRDEEVAASGVIIISGGFAQRRFGTAQQAVGKTLVVDGVPRAVVGVMPSGFSLLFQGGEAWIPLDLSREQQAKVANRNIAVYGRLRPGVSLSVGQENIVAIQRQLRDETPTAYAATRVAVRPLRQALFGDQRSTMLVLLIAVALVVAIAVVNVANLVLADALARRTITMTRVALGARPRALALARIGEMALLAGASFAIAVPLCAAGLRLLAAISPQPFVPLAGRWMEPGIVGITCAIAAFIAFAGGLPAVILEARTQAAAIAGSLTRAGMRGTRRAQFLLGAAQAAVTVVLLGIGVLLSRDLARLMATPSGFVADGVIVTRLNVLSPERATFPLRSQYADALVRAVRGVPGVIDVSAIQSRFNLNETMQTSVEIEGFAAAPGQRPFSQIRHVMPNVFHVLGVRLLAGRGIDSTDRADGRPVAVVSRSFAKRYWPGENPIGKRLRRGSPDAPWLDVVGMVDDVSDAGLGVPLGPTLYVPYLQQNTATARVTLVARAARWDRASIDGIRRAIWSVNPRQAIDDITPLTTLMLRTAAQPRFRTMVVVVFGASAALLVLAGVYAVTVFSVLSRRRELGIRSAIGGSPASLTLLVMRSSVAPVLLGGIIGALMTVPAAALTSTIIQPKAQAEDLLMSLSAVVALLATAGVAALIPAIGATRVSPSTAIRGE